VTKFQKSLAAVSVVIALFGVMIIAVRASYGAYAHTYRVTGTFVRASYGVEPGTQVEHHGIAVGKVDSVSLVNQQAQLRLSIKRGFQVPTSVQAVVRPRSIFGDPYIDLDFVDGSPGPFLVGGSHLDRTGVDAETGDLIASVVPLLQKINPQDLSVVIDELSKTGDNESLKIRSQIENGAQLANLYASTINSQLTALDSFAQFQSAIVATGPTLNAIAANSNIALPTLNAAEADFQRALDAIKPFADKLATFIAAERPDITRLLDQGDNVVRLLTAREPQVEQVISGLSQYVFKLGAGAGAETLPNGTKFAYFKNFVLFSDINNLVCGLIAPPQPGLGFLAPLQKAVGSSGVFNCSAFFAAEAAAKSTPSAAPAATAAPAAPVLPAPQSVAGALSQAVNQIIGQPEVPQPVTLQTLVDHILGKS
jgi:phospholipid/cholesterol/gamma-HCH transport system substrate-binding protein